MILYGIVISIIGYAIRLIAIRNMNINNPLILTIPKRLVCWGIYKYVRHPMYIGSAIMFFGICLILTMSIGTSICFLYLLIQFLLDRIHREEQILFESFGKEYLEYRKRTKF